MIHIAKQSPMAPLQMEPTWTEACIALELDDGHYLLDDGRIAQQATSCLLAPELGDRVLTATCGQNDNYILHILRRSPGAEAFLSVPGASQLTMRQARIALSGTEQVSVHALHNVDITAAAGVLTLSARNLFSTVTESLVENVRHYVGNVEQYLLDVKKLLRMHGKQASVTAEQDVKVDAERISMG